LSGTAPHGSRKNARKGGRGKIAQSGPKGREGEQGCGGKGAGEVDVRTGSEGKGGKLLQPVQKKKRGLSEQLLVLGKKKKKDEIRPPEKKKKLIKPREIQEEKNVPTTLGGEGGNRALLTACRGRGESWGRKKGG